jgi:hypothetical protein
MYQATRRPCLVKKDKRSRGEIIFASQRRF